MENLPAVNQKIITLRDFLESEKIKKQFADALPKFLDINRFFRCIHGEVIRNPKLADCTRETLLRSIMVCAQLGLEPVLGLVYLIPYNNSRQIAGNWVKVLECQVQIGWQGFLALARRSGEIAGVEAKVVYQNDIFDILYGTEERITYKPHLGPNPGEPIGAYAKWIYKNGHSTFDFMPLHEIYKRRDKSQSYQFAKANPKNAEAQKCPWLEWPGEMMIKTVIKHSAKFQPLSVDVLQAVSVDDQLEVGGLDELSPAFAPLQLPESPKISVDDFNREFSDILGDPSFLEFMTLAQKGNSTTGEPISVDEVKILAMKDKRGPDAFRKAFESFRTVRNQKSDVPAKKATKTKGRPKKSSKSPNGAAETGKKAASNDPDSTVPKQKDSEFEALLNDDVWQEVIYIKEKHQKLYGKYEGGKIRNIADATEFCESVYADEEYSPYQVEKSGIPGA